MQVTGELLRRADGQVVATATLHVLDGPDVVLSGDYPSGILVPMGQTAEVVGTVTTPRNVVVQGTLRMRPGSTLRFRDVDESKFVGGHTNAPLATDVGLWVVDHGRLDAEGSDKVAWASLAGGFPAGATALELDRIPIGWLPGDDLAVTPTLPPSTSKAWEKYSYAKVASVSGNTVTLDTPLQHNHPAVDVDTAAGPKAFTAEVLNLTRDARIEGEPGGRAHVIFLHAHGAQTVRNVELRHVGPRQPDGSYTEGVMGRYPLHWHRCREHSAGTVVEGVVVRDSGNRAFVAHASDGITFTDCIAHDVFDDAYWWDRRDSLANNNWEPGSENIVYDRCVASLIRCDPTFRGFTHTGFELGHGRNMTVVDCVAVGVLGNKSASGFKWPEGTAIGRDIEGGPWLDFWKFENNVSHNNKIHGFFVWQNTSDPRHLVEDSVCYHNGKNGVDHGAYGNRYTYRRVTVHGNGEAGLMIHAQSGVTYEDMIFDGAGVTPYGLATHRHRSLEQGSVLRRPVIKRYTDKGVVFLAPQGEPTVLDIVDPIFDGPESTWFWLANSVPDGSVIRVQVDGSAFRLRPASSSQGELVPEWNARREPIPPFAG